MIRTGEIQVGKFIVTDDVNIQNVELIKNLYKISDLYISKRFDIPMNDYKYTQMNGSSTYNYIEEQLRTVEQLVKSGKKTIVQGETPLANFKLKINYWCNTIFKGVIDKLDDDKVVNILIHNSVSKHECQLLSWLNSVGVNITIITKEVNKLGVIPSNAEQNIYNTSDNFEYKEDEKKVVEVCDVKTLSDIEKTIYQDGNTVKVCVLGVDNYIDTCDFFGKLYINSENNKEFKLFINGFKPVTSQEANNVPRFKKDNHDYIVQTLAMFVNIQNKNIEQQLKNSLKDEFNSGANNELRGSILYNKILYCIMNINNIVNDEVKHVIFFGEASKNDCSIIRILNNVQGMSVIVLQPDKNKAQKEITDVLNTIEFESSIENMEIPKVDSRDNVRTTGAMASRIANETLYNGQLLGIYKPGQFCTCETRLFSTAYEEIELWWNKDMFNRPNFSAQGIKAVLPVMFKVINGVQDKYKYTNEVIGKYLYGNTVLCRNVGELRSLITNNMHILRCTDIQNTSFEEQKPFLKGDKLNKQQIKRGTNYSYGYLSEVKQDFILSKIEEIINTDKIVVDNKDKYVDTVLNTLLNLGKELVRIIQWFEFYTDNPNLVLTMADEQMLQLQDIVLIMFMHSIGFDILIFVPTSYRSIDGLVTSKFQYDTHNIGYAAYDMDTSHLSLDMNKKVDSISSDNQPDNKKKSIFKRIFGG